MIGGGFLLFKSAKGLSRIGFYVFFRGRQCALNRIVRFWPKADIKNDSPFVNFVSEWSGHLKTHF